MLGRFNQTYDIELVGWEPWAWDTYFFDFRKLNMFLLTVYLLIGAVASLYWRMTPDVIPPSFVLVVHAHFACIVYTNSVITMLISWYIAALGGTDLTTYAEKQLMTQRDTISDTLLPYMCVFGSLVDLAVTTQPLFVADMLWPMAANSSLLVHNWLYFSFDGKLYAKPQTSNVIVNYPFGFISYEATMTTVFLTTIILPPVIHIISTTAARTIAPEEVYRIPDAYYVVEQEGALHVDVAPRELGKYGSTQFVGKYDAILRPGGSPGPVPGSPRKGDEWNPHASPIPEYVTRHYDDAERGVGRAVGGAVKRPDADYERAVGRAVVKAERSVGRAVLAAVRIQHHDAVDDGGWPSSPR